MKVLTILHLAPDSRIYSPPFSAFLCARKLTPVGCITWALLPLGGWWGWPMDYNNKTGRRGWASSPVLPCSGTVSLAAAASFHDYCSLLVTSPPQLQLSLGPSSPLVQGVTASSSP